MVLTDNKADYRKLDAYRLGVDQPTSGFGSLANTAVYCTYLHMIALSRLLLDMPLTLASTSPDPAVAGSLLTFLEQRYVATYEANGLNCMGLLKLPDPITITKDANGVAVNGTINGVQITCPAQTMP